MEKWASHENLNTVITLQMGKMKSVAPELEELDQGQRKIKT